MNQAIDGLLHLLHVTAERQNVFCVGYSAILEDSTVAELHDTDLHVFEAVKLALVLLDELSNEGFESLEALFPKGAAAVDGQDQVLLGHADFVATTFVRVAFLQPIADPGFRLRALPISTDGDDNSPRLSVKPPPHATEHGDHCVHFLSLQLRSQEPVLHGRDSEAVLQDWPPFFGCTLMLRVR